ncbi:membrane protein insertion efficiency factor YidD [Micromonospora okii]|uniref:membrane protein insertion efficiency factor YidD n=1 Tax=Micromonospora okii TaxID=1182970 RepID=UPI001E366A22|nr:membrane protein insertion efficiency factor YidD [Micromonospora okii]
MIRRLWETARENRRQQDKFNKHYRSKNPAGCCDCCDLGLFSTLLTLGAATAAATRAPALDRAGVAAIRGYRRWLSPHWPGQCRFTPTCGAYGLVAVERHGLAVGGRMAAERLRRCRPGVPRGTHDPVRPAGSPAPSGS